MLSMVILASAQHIWSNIHPGGGASEAKICCYTVYLNIQLSPSPGKNLSMCCCCSLNCMAKCFPPHPFPVGKQPCLSSFIGSHHHHLIPSCQGGDPLLAPWKCLHTADTRDHVVHWKTCCCCGKVFIFFNREYFF